jgi:CheY-like chemotaxis protein
MPNFVALVVEDDALQRVFLTDLLKGRGLEVVECSTAEAPELWQPRGLSSKSL